MFTELSLWISTSRSALAELARLSCSSSSRRCSGERVGQGAGGRGGVQLADWQRRMYSEPGSVPQSAPTSSTTHTVGEFAERRARVCLPASFLPQRDGNSSCCGGACGCTGAGCTPPFEHIGVPTAVRCAAGRAAVLRARCGSCSCSYNHCS